MMSASERRRRSRIGNLVADETSRRFLLELTDEVLRIHTARRAARRLARLVATYPRVAMAGRSDRLALRAAALCADVAPRPVVALATARLRRELGTLVLPAEDRPLAKHLGRRRAQGMRVNVNLLGEAVLGEGQAQVRARLVAELLRRPDVDCVSVKLSALDSQLDVLAYRQSLERVASRLRGVLAAAAAHDPAKLVYFDMEEYRDLALTVDAFVALLCEPEFASVQAGIALQAYLPDSAEVLERLCAFARTRRAEGGAPIRVRLVKGANLAMEKVEAELRGWEQAPYRTKGEVDANYKRLLDIALREENAGAVQIGAASHNLFDVAWALGRDREAGGGRVEIEMLEGMAVAEAQAVARTAGSVLLYAPVVRRGDFESAVAYLVRRFDENTAPENFLAHAASLRPGSREWEDQRARFRRAVHERHGPPGAPHRRPTLGRAPAQPPPSWFANVPDTDFTVEENRRALQEALDRLRRSAFEPVVAVVDGSTVDHPLHGIGIDPSNPHEPLYRYVTSDPPTVERAVGVARRAAPAWAARSAEERRELLYAVADEMERSRAHTIAVMVFDGGKVVREADAEVSEAVDAARYYADQAVRLGGLHGDATFSPHGVVVVAPPWNFPYAIPSGGALAALAAGNAVILKPAPETVATAATLVAQCQAAGVPGDVLQFVPCADDEAGRRLVTHPQVDAVVLTGAFDTARTFLEWRPTLVLRAETSGKNALVVTASADLEDAVRDLVHSAFSHGGQKCSAASLAILEAPVYDDDRFLQRLADAVASQPVGAAWDLATRVGPLIRPPEGPLRRALTQLAEGERWLVEPRQLGDNPHLWTPGVKLGVAPGSELHLTECFGPVLGVMRARDLDHALELQNATPYGLTGGISTLDDREVEHWAERVAVGNVYVNRHITGAIVRRQPFGGWKRSSVGAGAKAGGPNYVASLGRWSRTTPYDREKEIDAAMRTARELMAGVDESGLAPESNVFRLRPLRRVTVRVGSGATADELEALTLSLQVAALLGTQVEISAPRRRTELGVPGLPAAPVGDWVVEDERALVTRIRERSPDRVRLVASAPSLRLALLETGAEVDDEPVVASGTYELLRWTHEQAVSRTLHRHGNVVVARSEVAHPQGASLSTRQPWDRAL